MSLLRVENLSLSIGPAPILHKVSFAAKAGRITGLIGESGSGKSMTAYAITRLLPKEATASGRILLDGANLLDKSERAMCALRGDDIGLVFQEPMTALNPVKTIGAQVAETVRLHRGASRTEAAAIARDTLNRVGLAAAQFPLSRYPHELSGGQRQRVVIAMAIALRPRLLIADEPTTALDVTTQAGILRLLKKLVAEDGMGLVLISHDLGVVADMADDLVIMRKGEVVESGPTARVFATQAHPYTRALIRASAHQPQRDAHSGETPLLDVQNLVRDYALPRASLFAAPGRFRAVDDVSFTLKKGENLGLVGESGCGKSTLTRAILGLEAAQGGTIAINGQPVRAGQKMPATLRRHLQVVFQDPYASFNPRHRVARLVSEPFHLMDDAPRGAARAQAVAEALESVGLTAADATRYIHEFSGGQRQRIAIARALITRPELIILDEAVSALDVSIRAQILDLLADLSARFGLSYLFISHDLHVVRKITDRVMVMQAGRIVESGATEAVFAAPQHPYTAALLAAAPHLEIEAHDDALV